jgi:cell division protease FtsH
LAATNRPEILDPALLRAGRFDRQVLVDRPDKKGRIQILNVHMKKVKTAPDVDVDKVAALTPGFTGADLANLVNEAALLATRRREREIVAYHEMGHALVAHCPALIPFTRYSIIPRGLGALGYTLQCPTEDRFLMTREELQRKMAVLLWRCCLADARQN